MGKQSGKVEKQGWSPVAATRKAKGVFAARPFPERVATRTSQPVASHTPLSAQEVQAKSLLPSDEQWMPVQAKLTIGEPGDPYEQEADRVAKEVVQRLQSDTTDQPSEEGTARGGELPVQRQTIVPSLQRRGAFSVRRSGRSGGAASPEFERGLSAARGGGRPLDAGFRAKVEPLMGGDFSGVRVHINGAADELSRSIQAKAFTTGHDVFFRKGEYAPGTRAGKELLAHELTHVVQQREEPHLMEEVERKIGFEVELYDNLENYDTESEGTYVDGLTWVQESRRQRIEFITPAIDELRWDLMCSLLNRIIWTVNIVEAVKARGGDIVIFNDMRISETDESPEIIPLKKANSKAFLHMTGPIELPKYRKYKSALDTRIKEAKLKASETVQERREWSRFAMERTAQLFDSRLALLANLRPDPEAQAAVQDCLNRLEVATCMVLESLYPAKMNYEINDVNIKNNFILYPRSNPLREYTQFNPVAKLLPLYSGPRESIRLDRVVQYHLEKFMSDVKEEMRKLKDVESRMLSPELQPYFELSGKELDIQAMDLNEMTINLGSPRGSDSEGEGMTSVFDVLNKCEEWLNEYVLQGQEENLRGYIDKLLAPKGKRLLLPEEKYGEKTRLDYEEKKGIVVEDRGQGLGQIKVDRLVESAGGMWSNLLKCQGMPKEKRREVMKKTMPCTKIPKISVSKEIREDGAKVFRISTSGMEEGRKKKKRKRGMLRKKK